MRAPESDPDAVEIPREARRPFAPRGAALALWKSNAREVLIDGVAGSGKTRIALEKALYCAMRWPGTRVLLVRKTRASMTDSVLETFENEVIPVNHACLARGGERSHRGRYVLPNGSEIVVGGMDKAARIMSTRFDLICVFESTELSEDEYEHLTTRARGTAMPYRQMICDCNPAAPSHWLKRRADSGKMARFPSRHQDNPLLWDVEANDWTPEGREYLDRLSNLTGHRRDRLLLGLWAAAEGLVYPDWDAAVHLVDPFEIPQSWGRFISVDFGFRNPFVAQWWALDEDDRMYLYREIYRTGRLVEDHAEEMADLGAVGLPIVCDHDAEGRATLERHLGARTYGARKAIKVGIQAVTSRLRKQEDGRPRLLIFRDALVSRDRKLAAAKLPTCTAEEFESYVYPAKGGKEDVPEKKNDHGVDCARYASMHVDGGSRYRLPDGEEAEALVPVLGDHVVALPGDDETAYPVTI